MQNAHELHAVLVAESKFYSGSLDLCTARTPPLSFFGLDRILGGSSSSSDGPGILHLHSIVSLTDLCELVGGTLLLELSVESIALADSWNVVSVPARC